MHVSHYGHYDRLYNPLSNWTDLHDNIMLKVIYHPYMLWIIMSLYGLIGYHVTLSEGDMIADHPI